VAYLVLIAAGLRWWTLPVVLVIAALGLIYWAAFWTKVWREFRAGYRGEA
jgi:hypothetical protein